MMSGSQKQTAGASFGKYEILDFLGRGGMAEVYKAKLHGIGGFEKVLVIKKILPELARSENFIKMFFDEAKITVALQHPNIVQVFDLGEIDGTFFMSMEYVEGCNLNTLMGRCMKKKTKLPFKHLIFVMMEVCKALHYAHRAVDSSGLPLNLVHRDVTHSNILISYRGEVKLSDFGIARARIQQSKEDPNVIKGKMSYMAPELFSTSAIDSRADIFSLGIVFMEILTMKKLFKVQGAEDVAEQVMGFDVDLRLREFPTIPDDIQDVMRKALSVDLGGRYRSAQELYTDLNDFIFNNGIQISPHEFADFVSGIMLEKRSIVGVEEEKERESAAPGISEVFKKESSSLSQDVLAINLGVMESFKPDPSLLGEPAAHGGRQARPESEAGPERTGEIKSYLLPRLLARMAAGGLTGRLNILAGDAAKAVFFEEGGVTYIESELSEDSMEKYLIEYTELDLLEIEEVAAIRKGDDVLLHFHRENKITQEQMMRCLLSSFRDRLAGILGVREGSYEFYKGMKPAWKLLSRPIPAFRLFAEAIRKGLTYEDYLQAVGRHLDRILVQSEKSRLELDQVALNEEEIAALGAIQLEKTLREIFESSSELESRNLIARVIYMLYQYELVSFG
jgi:serine/threonine-protein kinase